MVFSLARSDIFTIHTVHALYMYICKYYIILVYIIYQSIDNTYILYSICNKGYTYYNFSDFMHLYIIYECIHIQ